MTERKTKPEPDVGGGTPVFDRAHLAHYTMNDETLECEVLGLFLTQLGATLEMIGKAETPAEWRLWTHTLKGAAAAIGAWRLQAVAVALEEEAYAPGLGERPAAFGWLDEAVAELRRQIAADFPQLAA